MLTILTNQNSFSQPFLNESLLKTEYLGILVYFIIATVISILLVVLSHRVTFFDFRWTFFSHPFCLQGSFCGIYLNRYGVPGDAIFSSTSHIRNMGKVTTGHFSISFGALFCRKKETFNNSPFIAPCS